MAFPRKNYTVATEKGLNLRAEPTRKSKIIRVIPFGEKVVADNEVAVPDGWIAVKDGGYVMKEFLK